MRNDTRLSSPFSVLETTEKDPENQASLQQVFISNGFFLLSPETQSVHVNTYYDIIFSIVVNCSSVPDLNNGMVIYNSQGQDRTLVGATVTYTCDTGYTLSGSRMRTCQANGTWTGSDPTCNSECLLGRG